MSEFQLTGIRVTPWNQGQRSPSVRPKRVFINKEIGFDGSLYVFRWLRHSGLTLAWTSSFPRPDEFLQHSVNFLSLLVSRFLMSTPFVIQWVSTLIFGTSFKETLYSHNFSWVPYDSLNLWGVWVGPILCTSLFWSFLRIQKWWPNRYTSPFIPSLPNPF